MTPDENDLPPCPFCGSAARMVQLTTLPEDDPNWNGCYIECCNATCAASTNIHFGEADKALREKWSRRAGVVAYMRAGGHMTPDEIAKDVIALFDRIHDLEDRLAVAEKDAERYRWLKINARRIDFAGLCVSDGAQLDARIDAAIRAEAK